VPAVLFSSGQPGAVRTENHGVPECLMQLIDLFFDFGEPAGFAMTGALKIKCAIDVLYYLMHIYLNE
jgi:hypothetical protein